MPTSAAHAWTRVIAHADLDAFYASVEQLDNPKLRGQPVLVGPPSGRGVVLTASYEARPFGVGSAMPMVQATRRCPDAVIVPPRFARYQELSAKVMAVFYDFSPHVEAISLDEAFLDMSGTEHLFGDPEAMARRLKDAVFAATGGLSISVGVSATKYVAKVASGYEKPNAVTVVHPQAAVAWLAPQSVSRLWGAGPKTQARLQAGGYFTVGDVARANPADLRALFGVMGGRFHELANARDTREVARGPTDYEQAHGLVSQSTRSRSMSSERTLTADVVSQADLAAHLTRAADRLGRRLRSNGWLAGGVRVKLKTSDFRVLTRQCSCSPTDSAADLMEPALTLLPQFNHPGPFRLVGLTAHALQKKDTATQFDLFSATQPTRELEEVIDELSARFGDGVVRRARDLGSSTVIRQSPNLDFMDDLRDDLRDDFLADRGVDQTPDSDPNPDLE